MDAAEIEGYKPLPEFCEDEKEPLIELSVTDSTELWLVQWPINQPPDFDDQELQLKLHEDGHLGSFEGSSGKRYEVISSCHKPEATVFVTSSSNSETVGKIARRVSLVHYPEPNELDKAIAHPLKKMYQRSVASTITNSSYPSTPSQATTKLRNLDSAVGNGGKKRSGKPFKLSKRTPSREASRSEDTGGGCDKKAKTNE